MNTSTDAGQRGSPAERKLAAMTREDLLTEAEMLRVKLQALDYRGCYWDANIVQKLAAFASPVTPAAAVDREALCSLIEAKCPRYDEAFDLPIGGQVEALADAIVALIPAAATIPEGMLKPFEHYDGDLPDYDHPLRCVFESGVQYAVDLLAKTLDVTDYDICDGTEEYDGDLGGTMFNIVLAAMPTDENGDHLHPSEVREALNSPIPPATIPGGDWEALDALQAAVNEAANECHDWLIAHPEKRRAPTKMRERLLVAEARLAGAKQVVFEKQISEMRALS